MYKFYFKIDKFVLIFAATNNAMNSNKSTYEIID